MKIKFKLCIMMIAIVLVVAGGIAIIELQKSKSIILQLAKQKTLYLARQRAMYWDGRLNGYINILDTLSNIFNFYENIPVADRRQRFEDNLRGVFEDTPDFVRIATIWRPNAIDGNDARNINRPGSTPTGQFAFTLTRETGDIKVMTSGAVQDTMDIINGPNARVVCMSDPAPMTNMGKETYAVRITAPIINTRTNQTVGAVLCQFDTGFIQPTIENTIKTNEEVTSSAIYSDNGFIFGNYLKEFVGKKIDEETQYNQNLKTVKEAIKNAKEWEGVEYDPELKTNMVMAIANIPIGTSPTTWSVMIGSAEDYIMRDVNAIKRLVFIILTVVVVVVVASIVVTIVVNIVVVIKRKRKEVEEEAFEHLKKSDVYNLALKIKDELGKKGCPFGEPSMIFSNDDVYGTSGAYGMIYSLETGVFIYFSEYRNNGGLGWDRYEVSAHHWYGIENANIGILVHSEVNTSLDMPEYLKIAARVIKNSGYDSCTLIGQKYVVNTGYSAEAGVEAEDSATDDSQKDSVTTQLDAGSANKKRIPNRVKIDDKWYDVDEGWAGTLNLRWGSGSDIRKYTAKEPYIHISNLYFVYDSNDNKVGEFNTEHKTYSGSVTAVEF